MTVEQNVLQQHSQKVGLQKLTWWQNNFSLTIHLHSCLVRHTCRGGQPAQLFYMSTSNCQFFAVMGQPEVKNVLHSQFVYARPNLPLC